MAPALVCCAGGALPCPWAFLFLSLSAPGSSGSFLHPPPSVGLIWIRFVGVLIMLSCSYGCKGAAFKEG